MKIEILSDVPASREATWALVMDIPKAASCIPGIKDITPDGEGKYQATLQARVGPMGMNLSGTITVLSQDADAGEAYFLVEANDRRVGGGIKTNIAKAARISDDVAAITGSDPAQSKADFEKMFRTTPEEAASTILKGVRQNKRRVLIGSDALAIDTMQRLLPTSYQRLMVMGQKFMNKK